MILFNLDKRGSAWIPVLIVLVIVILAVGIFSFLFFSGFGIGESEFTGQIKNPTSGKSLEESVIEFDESFVEYLLYSIGAGKLRKIPLTGEKPKIEFYIGDEIYTAVVTKGVVSVSKSAIEDSDFIIRTTTEEAVKMIQDSNYIGESFSSGKVVLSLKRGRQNCLLKVIWKFMKS